MKAPKPPRLFLHATGQWASKWGGRFHYFGAVEATAQVKYLDSIKDWMIWQQSKRSKLPSQVRRPHLVIGLSERFLKEKADEGGTGRRRHYENHLRLFLHTYGRLRGDMIRGSHLNDFRAWMVKEGYAPRTINHHLSAVKSLLYWASGLDLIPLVNLRTVRGMVLPPVPDKSLSKKQVRHILAKTPDRARPWVAINYLCLMRPSEVVRVVNGWGEWEEKWLFRLHQGKVDSRTQEFRRIVFSDRALWWLEQCEPHWTRQDSYYRALARAGVPDAPHPLRHTAATHLARLGAARADIDLLLGHLPPRVSRTYVRIDWRALRGTVARLRL